MAMAMAGGRFEMGGLRPSLVRWSDWAPMTWAPIGAPTHFR